MGPDLTAILDRLGLNLDQGANPVTLPGVIKWIGRIAEVNPSQMNYGLEDGMEVWTTGKGFAPFDLPSVESWLFDAPRGSHLLLTERRLSFEPNAIPTREGRSVVLWTRNDIAEFIGLAILDGTIQIIDDEIEEFVEDTIDENPFAGDKIRVLSASNDFKLLEEAGLDIGLARPILLNGKIHCVSGILKGPDETEVKNWVLNCGGLHLLNSIEVLERNPMFSRLDLPIEEKPNFSQVLSERRVHSEGLGDLLHWWRFDNDTANVETYDVLVPAHQGSEGDEKTWILEGVTSTLHRHQ
jgi:hypothetical protein